MRKKPNDKILREINNFFELAKKEAKKHPETAARHVSKARKLAKRSNFSIKSYRKFFCRKCNSYFTSENSQVRIKKGIRSIKCLKCGAYRRSKLG